MGTGSRAALVPKMLPVDEVLGAIYRIDLSTEDWLRNLRSIEPIDESHGYAMAIFKHRSPSEGGGWMLEAYDADERARDVLIRSTPSMQTGGSNELVPPSLLCGSQSETMGCFPLPEPWGALYASSGCADVWGVFGRSAEGHLIALTRLMPRRARTPPRARRFWHSASIHLSTAYRLQSIVHRTNEAVLAPDGKILHAEGVARDEASREALRRAARAIDQAKLKHADPLAAIESWTAMVEGRWSLVDQFESDGRRFLVARVNEPKLSSRADLSGREQHISALAALGRSNKEIAYELGLQPTTVASYLGRARKKLGVRRSALIR